MGLIPHTRQLLNVSQYHLSQYLAIPRNTLKMVENDLRQLSNEKFAQVLELNRYLEISKPLEALTKAKAYQQTEQQEVQAYARERIVLLRHQQKQWQAKLDQQRATYQKRLRAYHAFAQANAQLDDKPKHQQSWLRLHYRLTQEKLEKNGQKVLLKLEIKLAAIASELAVLERYGKGK
ncbi:MAG TPA: hypothetical protein DCS93_13770 [Microscillaceae bacterium]|nr:hypothetical protein [Microscillaceae bacterium]